MRTVNAQIPGESAAVDALFMRVADAYRAFAASISTIKFPAAIQGAAQGLITDANNAAGASAGVGPAIANGDTAPINQAQQAENTFISNQTAFEAQFRQAL